MIRTNLSTRPFYNERAVQLVAARRWPSSCSPRPRSTSSRVLRYSQQRHRAGDAGVARRSARRRAARSRRRSCAPASIPQQIDCASADARQANELIDRRTFSWTELFNRFETTLPDDVRIAVGAAAASIASAASCSRSASWRAASTTSTQFIDEPRGDRRVHRTCGRPRSTPTKQGCSRSTPRGGLPAGGGAAGAARRERRR